MKHLDLFSKDEPRDSAPEPRIDTTPQRQTYGAPQPRTYSVEDHLQVIANDLYVYDIRNWPHGITPSEVERLYQSLDQPSAWGFFNSGRGWDSLRYLKQQGVSAERIAEVIEENKGHQLAELRKHWERSLAWYWDCYLNSQDANCVARGLQHAEDCYLTLCRLHEELKLEPPKRPEWLDYSVERILDAKSQSDE